MVFRALGRGFRLENLVLSTARTTALWRLSGFCLAAKAFGIWGFIRRGLTQIGPVLKYSGIYRATIRVKTVFLLGLYGVYQIFLGR